MNAGRFEVRNARVSITGNLLPKVAYRPKSTSPTREASRCSTLTHDFSP